jgi:hypothetical protein
MSDLIYLRGKPSDLKPIIMQVMAMHQLIESKDIGTIYAYTNDLESVKRVGKPKVTLFFLQDTDFQEGTTSNIPRGRRRVEGVIRFRLMNESTQTFSKANGTTLGNRIKEVFGANGGFVWSKGKTLYSYNDWENGYQFQLLCRTKSEAKRIIATVLSLQNYTPDWKRLFEDQNDQEATTYPENPGTQIVMGETVPIPHSRPNVNVRFQYAYVSLDGVKEPINLYDRTHKRVKPLAS